jgi:23S rRNA (adenine2503-C2)-methyltransferase
MIKKIADDGFPCEFALSLHAANDAKRSEMMPINETNSLEALIDALRYFYTKTNTRVTFEYIIFHDFNDSLQDAKELAQFARCVPCKINIIEYNPIVEASYQNTTEKRMNEFIEFLQLKRFIVNVRRSRGKDVDGGCGQLSLKIASPQKETELILW